MLVSKLARTGNMMPGWRLVILLLLVTLTLNHLCGRPYIHTDLYACLVNSSNHAWYACLQVLKEVQPSAHENGYQLSLAIVNAFGEKGNVAAVREHLQSFLRLYGNAPNAVTYGYMALIKAYRCAPLLFLSFFLFPISSYSAFLRTLWGPPKLSPTQTWPSGRHTGVQGFPAVTFEFKNPFVRMWELCGCSHMCD